jgi:hypothetical protein
VVADDQDDEGSVKMLMEPEPLGKVFARLKTPDGHHLVECREQWLSAAGE